jgi:hypothetical protein
MAIGEDLEPLDTDDGHLSSKLRKIDVASLSLVCSTRPEPEVGLRLASKFLQLEHARSSRPEKTHPGASR